MGCYWVQIGCVELHFIAIYLIVVAYIFTYYSIRKSGLVDKDPMNEKYYVWPVYDCPDEVVVSELDGWGISHFILYFVLGYLYPGNLLLFTLIGVIWEFIEQCVHVKSLYDDDPIKEKWWVGKVTDIGMNSFGLILGDAVSPFKK